MDELEKKTDGLTVVTDSGQIDAGTGRAVFPLLSSLRIVCQTSIDELAEKSPQSLVEATRILSRGMVLCAWTFIILSFIYPDRTSTAIGLATPLLGLYLQLRQKTAEKK